MASDDKRPRTVLGWFVGSDEEAFDMLKRLHLVEPLTRLAQWLSRRLP